MWTGLAESWRSYMQSLEVPPVMLTQEEFLKEVRKINPLVSLEHCRHLGLQLQVSVPTVVSFPFSFCS